MARHYKELKIWQIAVDFSVEIYKYTEAFPKNEQYGIISQLRKSAVSIASNIAEGSERRSDKEFIRFLNIAKGSLAECETQCIISLKLGFLIENDYTHLQEIATRLGKMINSLSNKLETVDQRLETVNA
jgi:four helix bundle protein